MVVKLKKIFNKNNY